MDPTGAPGQRSQPGVPLSSSVGRLFLPAVSHQLAPCFYSSFLDICNTCFHVLHCQKSWGSPILILDGLSPSKHCCAWMFPHPRCRYPGLSFLCDFYEPFSWLFHLLPPHASMAVLNFWGLYRQGSPLPLQRRDSAVPNTMIHTSRGNHHKRYARN